MRRYPYLLVIGLMLGLAGCGGATAASRPNAFATGASTVGATAAPTRAGTQVTPQGTQTPAAQKTLAAGVVDDSGESTAAQAIVRLRAEGLNITLKIVSENSIGVELDLWRDLRARIIRATTGPDEGINTRSESCYPYCVFVPFEERNALSVDAWVLVLRHEYRHMVQASHNPNLAADFRAPNAGPFTTYGAFSEACADYGLNVSTLYHAQERIDQVKKVVGSGMQALLDQACIGDKGAYDSLVAAYDQNRSAEPEFAQVFPPYS